MATHTTGGCAAETFSFADYYDPERIHFGALRVLNDDRGEAGMINDD